MNRLFRRALGAGALTAALFCAAAPPALADAGDLDRIDAYTVTVDPRPDGSADITYDIDWQVIGGSADDALSWVRIGLANDEVDEFENLTPDTVSGVRHVSDSSGSFAHVTFVRRYYAPDHAAATGQQSQVHFAFQVHQSGLYTLASSGEATYLFTPGWFDDLCVEQLTIRWKASDGMTADTDTLEDGYYIWTFGPMAHGEKATVQVRVPAGDAAAYDPGTAMVPTDDGDDMVFLALGAVFLILLFSLALYWERTARARWRGGFGRGDALFYTNGTRTIRLAPGAVPPAGFRPAPPPSDFTAGGGSFRGGGAGRRGGGGGCACACASSCACACACAGGGRAGCSVKNFYRVELPGHTPKEDTP